jgi:hypothetical protein
MVGGATGYVGGIWMVRSQRPVAYPDVAGRVCPERIQRRERMLVGRGERAEIRGCGDVGG